jgi:hypothetical protein
MPMILTDAWAIEKQGLGQSQALLMWFIGSIRAANYLFAGLAGKYDHQAQHDEWSEYK